MSRITFCIVAHPDDWQLFFMPALLAEAPILSGSRLVIVYINAGTDVWWDVDQCRARRQGADASAAVFANHGALAFPFTENGRSGWMTVREHQVRYFDCRNVRALYLQTYDHEGNTLKTLHTRYATNENDGTYLWVMDGINGKYEGWKDLVDTLGSMMTTELNGASAEDATIYTFTNDTTAMNPQHIAVGQLVADTWNKHLRSYNVTLYAFGANADKSTTSTRAQTVDQAVIYGALVAGQIDAAVRTSAADAGGAHTSEIGYVNTPTSYTDPDTLPTVIWP